MLIDYKVREILGGQKKIVLFNVCFFDGVVEYNVLEREIVKEVVSKFVKLMFESYDGYIYIFFCVFGIKCLQFFYIVFMGFIGEDCYIWIYFFCGDVVGYYFYFLDLMFLVDYGGVDVFKWKIFKVFYNNQIFDIIDELVGKFENNIINKIFVLVLKGIDVLFFSYEC